MANVVVEWLEGRSPEQKAQLAAEFTKSMSRIGGMDPDAVHVRFVDVSRGSWAVGGVLLDGTPSPQDAG